MNLDDNLKLTCVILTCDSHLNKGTSVLHSLLSVMNQDLDYFEVVLVDNSNIKPSHLKKIILEKVSLWNSKRKHPINVNIIQISKPLSVGNARNKGVEMAKTELVIFLDDDTILLDKNAFTQVYKLSRNYDFGYGAKRLWTEPFGWFQENSRNILNEMSRNNSNSLFENHLGSNAVINKDEDINFIQNKLNTFIANFGFCKKSIFNNIGGFPDFDGYGFEDDYLMFQLFEKGYKFCLLNKLKVAHVSHIHNENQKSNLNPYFAKLIGQGYFWFNVILTFSLNKINKLKILTPLTPLHFDYRVDEAYAEYINKIPLDIKYHKLKEKRYWRENNRFEKIEFARLLLTLQDSLTVDDFIKNSESDFDNLALVLKLGIKYGFVSISNKGLIKKIFTFQFTKARSELIYSDLFIKPDQKLNQFPCDSESVERRVALLKERYPFAEYLSLGIIGDDDFLSNSIINEFWIWPVVIEKDQRIIDSIKKLSHRYRVIDKDIQKMNVDNIPKVQTFIVDPPYTLDGSLAFIFNGLSMLVNSKDLKEFYVILNPTMMGKHLFNIQKILSSCGVYLFEVRTNFSRYKLPKNFQEYSRANNFLKSINIEPSEVLYSSSSNLYIFRTIAPDLTKLKSEINNERIYKHYL